MDTHFPSAFSPTKHFLQRMKERKITVDKVMDVLKNGIPKFQKHKEGIVEIIKDKIKIILDTIHRKLITVMHVYEKYAYLDKLVNDLEYLVWSQMKKAEKEQTEYDEKEINPENKLKFEDEVKIKKMIMPIPNP